jgi:hypothetical protein
MDDPVRDIITRIEALGRLTKRVEKQRWALAERLDKCNAEQLTELARQLKHQAEEVEHPDHVAESYRYYAEVARQLAKLPKARNRTRDRNN